jgi:hypothetical protein
MHSKINVRNVIAVICAAFFGVTLSLSLVAYNIENQLFNPAVYKKAITDQNFCERLPVAVTRQISSNAAAQGENNLLWLIVGSINPDKLQNLIELTLPCEVVEGALFNGVDQIFIRINDATAQPGLSLNPFKQIIADNSKSAFDEYFQSLPDCTPAELLEMGANALLGQEQNPVIACNPPEMLREVMTIPLQMVLDSAVQSLPDQINVFPTVGEITKTIRTARAVMNWSPLIPLFFLSLTTLLAVRSWRSFLIWWGYPLLISGLFTLVISLLVSPAVYASFSMLIFPNLPVNLVPEVIDLISDVLSAVTRGLALPIQFQAALLSLTGLGMVIGEKLTRPKPR